MNINGSLPNAAENLVESAKITEYLLSATHPIGKDKAEFFTAFGFSIDDADQMKNALRLHGQMRPIISETATEHGVKYELRCSITTPDARDPCITTVWIVEVGACLPRLVTAYPSKP